MKLGSKTKWTLCLIACLLLFALSIYKYLESSTFAEIADNTPGALELVVESEKLGKLREQVRAGEYRLFSRENVKFDILYGAVGLGNDFDGAISILCSEIPKYSLFNPSKNKEALALMLIRQDLLRGSVDGLYHVNESKNFGAVFVKSNVVEFQLLTDSGIDWGILVDADAIDEGLNFDADRNEMLNSTLVIGER